MTARRTVVWISSTLFGILSTAGTILIFGTTVEKFSFSNTILVFLAAGSLAFIWLDYFLQTNYLRR
jgi:hypothetical protein